MRLSIQAANGTLLCQASQLIAGFTALGHEHTDDITEDVSFVFIGNSPYVNWANLARTGVRKTIFNVLDTAHWTPDYPTIKATWPDQLNAANRVTCISETVQRDLADIGVKASVIYYPMKPVSCTADRKWLPHELRIRTKHPYRAMLVGRLQDPSKRAGLAVQSLVMAGFQSHEVAIVGPEYLGWGVKMGVVSDEVLNDLYNSVDYVIMASRYEGLGLPAIEAAICGAIPIVCPDMSTFNEFWVKSPLGLHYGKLNSPRSIADLILAIEADATWKAQLKQDIKGYAAREFVPRFDAKAVASRIISVYQTI